MVTEFFNENFSEERPDGETSYHRNTEGGKTRMPMFLGMVYETAVARALKSSARSGL